MFNFALLKLSLMEILDNQVTLDYIKHLADNLYGDMIKAVADVDRGLIAVDAELHSDLESFLLQDGSDQSALWGFNIYPEAEGEDFIEFDSLINIRPRQGNRSRDVEDSAVREKIKSIVKLYIK